MSFPSTKTAIRAESTRSSYFHRSLVSSIVYRATYLLLTLGPSREKMVCITRDQTSRYRSDLQEIGTGTRAESGSPPEGEDDILRTWNDGFYLSTLPRRRVLRPRKRLSGHACPTTTPSHSQIWSTYAKSRTTIVRSGRGTSFLDREKYCRAGAENIESYELSTLGSVPHTPSGRR